jgi:16S rRNA (cytosine1402-N4)-methyltransferase
MEHVPVLLNEVLKYLDPKPGENFVDATANGGGHLFEIAKRISPGGKAVGIETDADIFQKLEAAITKKGIENCIAVHDSYIHIEDIVGGLKIPVNGALFDLGFSSIQLEESGRGFSFMKDEPLDMRFDTEGNLLRASDIINHGTRAELEKIFKEYGEERYARKIAEGIGEERKRRPILRTTDLVSLILHTLPRHARFGKIHFATRVFQALRIAVNNEFENIEKGLEAAIKCLEPGGRIAVISFHSLEDRIVKNFFKKEDGKRLSILTSKPIPATREEISKNNRARSAKVRAAVKI